MKKKIIILFLLLIMPLYVHAVEVDYDVKEVYISADVDYIGSMHVKEAIVVKGSLNGFERVINYKNSILGSWHEGDTVNFEHSAIYNARGGSVGKVKSFKINKEDIGWNILSSEVNDLELVESAYKGDSGKYTKVKTDNGYKIRVYNPNSSGYIVYLFDYYVDQLVVLHNDVAELYWQFIPTDFDDIGEAHIQVTVPGSSTNDTFRMWAHGPLTGSIAGILGDNSTEETKTYRGVLANVTNVSKGMGTDIRMTFDKSIVNMGKEVLNTSGVDALDKIIEVEEKRANAANRERTISNVKLYGLMIISGAYIIGLIILWIHVYRKHDKEYDVGFDAKYYREFTGEYDVEVIDYLMNKTITTNAMSASIMNLIYKKKIEAIENPEDKKNPILKLLNRDGLNSAESILVELLFDEIGNSSQVKMKKKLEKEILNKKSNSNEVSMKDIEKYSRKYSTAENFMKKYNSWHDEVEKLAIKEDFYEDKTGDKAVALLYAFLGVVIIGVTILCEAIFIPTFIAVIVSTIAFFIYVLSFQKYTPKGREHYLKWSAFKNFLKDFGSFSDKELPEIKLWEKYLVYATIFGLAKEVQKTMKVKLTEMGYDDMYYHNYWYFNNYNIANSINSTVVHAHSSSMAQIAASSSSSGSGFGGGFSGGGGFGGGGGSGGGF